MIGYNLCEQLLQEAHVIIGGTSGSGKSVLLNDILYTIAAHSPDKYKIVLCDPKRVELYSWSKLPHCIDYAESDTGIMQVLGNVIATMECRYADMKSKGLKQSTRPHIYVIIDEGAQVFRIKGASDKVEKLMQLSRAANIHVIIATQNVSRKGIPATIWQNADCTVGLRCKTPIESRQIIQRTGCESLPKYGFCIVNDSSGWCKWSVPLTPEKDIQERIKNL